MTEAEIEAQVLCTLGDQEAAEDWMQTPAIALDNQRPVDLIKTPQGARRVADHLTRIEYGVYT